MRPPRAIDPIYLDTDEAASALRDCYDLDRNARKPWKPVCGPGGA